MSHVALVVPGLDRIGGAEQQLLLLAKGLARRGWRVTVVALSGNGIHAAQGLRAAGAGFVSLGMRKGLADPWGWIRFRRWISREKPDVVHAHLPHAAWLARWSRLLAPVPVLIDTLHSSSTGTMGRRIGYCWSNWLPDRVTAVSRAVAYAHCAKGMASRSKLLVLPNGVDAQVWQADPIARETVRRKLGLVNGFLWLAVGRLDAVKDYPTLLRAMGQMPQCACLAMAGTGPLEAELRQLTTESDLGGRVHFLGFEPDVRRWMQAADGFVLSSHSEGLPMVLLEAGACGLPAVATDVPGTREVIVDGQTGILVVQGSAGDLAEGMKRVMALSVEERHTMGGLARCRVIEQFSLERVLNQWEGLYRELFDRNIRPRHWGRSA